MRIAILEDDPDQLMLVRHWLAPEGHDIHGYLAGRELMKYANRESFDLFILDWQVPDISGVDVLAWLRQKVSSSVPVLFTTVRDAEDDIVYALNTGADDYIVKPLSRPVLLARVNALLRRAYPETGAQRLSFLPFEFDLASGEMWHSGKRIRLTRKEFDLAVTLFRGLGRLFSRGYLQESVWGRSAHVPTRTVDTHISQLRKKLNLRAESGYRIVPAYNYGYRLVKVEGDAGADGGA